MSSVCVQALCLTGWKFWGIISCHLQVGKLLLYYISRLISFISRIQKCCKKYVGNRPKMRKQFYWLTRVMILCEWCKGSLIGTWVEGSPSVKIFNQSVLLQLVSSAKQQRQMHSGKSLIIEGNPAVIKGLPWIDVLLRGPTCLGYLVHLLEFVRRNIRKQYCWETVRNNILYY